MRILRLLALVWVAMLMPFAYGDTEVESGSEITLEVAGESASEAEANVTIEVPGDEAGNEVEIEVDSQAADEVEPEVSAEVGRTFEEGRHYTVFFDAPEAQAPEGKTEVMEFFWYNCPHCYDLEPFLKEWLEEREDTVHLRLVPTVFSARWAIGARVYYTLVELNRLDLHPVVFKLVHEQGRRLKTADGIGRMLAPFDVDPAKFAETFRSEAVTAHLEATRDLPEAYDLSGVPTLVVDGRYRIGSKNATNFEEMLEIADYLVRVKP